MQNPKDILKEILISTGFGGPRYNKPKAKSSNPPAEAPLQLPPLKDGQKSLRSFMSMLSSPFRSPKSFGSPSEGQSMKLVLDESRNPKDEKLVDSFRELLSHEGQLPQKHLDDHTLLRFLRMRNFDFTKAKYAFLQHIKWREEFRVDSILNEFKYEEHEDVKKCYPHGFHGVDRHGRPVYIERIGMVDLDKFLHVTTIDRFVKHHVYEQEKTLNLRYPACTVAAKKHINSTVSILDVKDVGMSKFSKPARYIFMEIQKIDSSYYPETLHRLFIINAGSGFKVLWKAIRAFLDTRTLEKIQVLGTDYQNSLIEAIEPSELPSFLGGECTCSEFGGCLFSDKGPWKDPENTKTLKGMLFTDEHKGAYNVNSAVEEPLLEKIKALEPVVENVKEKMRMLEVTLEETKVVLQGLARQIQELKR
ncbi:Phosphatidylinositol/phosphatidylcholine transfer protein SFH11 [Striga hermonthica]|uniref:Phosphatidylinositol/phosphatidylcholine transfer protein SFH11 n=1 Tax=Striga hermonthica TaxID=68872 RepID=A0A9N7NTR2_STRHE|nr:Phosphatidylinositol/phosphatidylcholine transfer protein SFH11 [Striga hermonthica]